MPRIRQRHLKRLLEGSLSLPEPADPALRRGPKSVLYGPPLADWPAPALAPAPGDERADAPASVTEKIAARSAIAACLRTLARRLDELLPGAIASARQAWEKVDALKILDRSVAAQIAETRGKLLQVAEARPALRAMALEGVVAIDTAWGLTRLFERRLSSLIRLRVRSGNDDLLPAGRPFLDLAAALHEAARAWS
ncbi:MAG TPA: hypothetical protein VIU64_01520 [Polyangia bacterium]